MSTLIVQFDYWEQHLTPVLRLWNFDLKLSLNSKDPVWTPNFSGWTWNWMLALKPTLTVLLLLFRATPNFSFGPANFNTEDSVRSCNISAWTFVLWNSHWKFSFKTEYQHLTLTHRLWNYLKLHFFTQILWQWLCSFSFDDHGMYDVPAAIDYILQRTGQKQVSIIGHSMGSTVGLVSLSMRPEYNEKTNVMILESPVSIFTHPVPSMMAKVLFTLAPVIEVNLIFRLKKTVWYPCFQFLQNSLKLLNINQIYPKSRIYSWAYQVFCKLPNLDSQCQYWFLSGTVRTNKYNPIDYVSSL